MATKQKLMSDIKLRRKLQQIQVHKDDTQYDYWQEVDDLYVEVHGCRPIVKVAGEAESSLDLECLIIERWMDEAMARLMVIKIPEKIGKKANQAAVEKANEIIKEELNRSQAFEDFTDMLTVEFALRLMEKQTADKKTTPDDETDDYAESKADLRERMKLWGLNHVEIKMPD
jgi:PP-loop superfamily ATP-utilizing enzyme